MSKSPDALTRLIKRFESSAQCRSQVCAKMAHQLLQHKRQEAENLVEALQYALLQVQHCRMCNNFCESDLCEICSDANRDSRRLMIVHMPADVSNMETANCHDGLYFVLMGQVSPSQGMDISHISLDKLVVRLQNSEVEEIIIATNFTAEGDATAYVLAELFKPLPYKVSRLARGIPLGGELEYVDAGTLAQAVYERRMLKTDSTEE